MRTVFLHLARDGHLGEGFLPVDFYIRVAFVILQPNVEAWTVALDQIHFQDERFELRADHDPFDVRNLAHQAACLVVMSRIVVEV